MTEKSGSEVNLRATGGGNGKIPHHPPEENGEMPPPPPGGREGATHPPLDENEGSTPAHHLPHEDVIKRCDLLLLPEGEENQIIPRHLPPEIGADAPSHPRHVAGRDERRECRLHPLLPLVDDFDQVRHLPLLVG